MLISLYNSLLGEELLSKEPPFDPGEPPRPLDLIRARAERHVPRHVPRCDGRSCAFAGWSMSGDVRSGGEGWGSWSSPKQKDVNGEFQYGATLTSGSKGCLFIAQQLRGVHEPPSDPNGSPPSPAKEDLR